MPQFVLHSLVYKDNNDRPIRVMVGATVIVPTKRHMSPTRPVTPNTTSVNPESNTAPWICRKKYKLSLQFCEDDMYQFYSML